MAFGIPGSEANGGGEYLSRIQYDARVGFWQIVKRVQDGTGAWVSDMGEQFKNPTMLFDFGSLEIGYTKFAKPPEFKLVPYGKPIPARPDEMALNDRGQQRKTFLPGFRIKVASQKTFGDSNAYYFAHNAKTVMEPMDELHQQFLAAPQAAAGQLPLVAVTGTRTIDISGNKYHAPVFAIVAWHDRPDVFGERTVASPAAPVMAMAAASVPAQQGTARAASPPARAPAMADSEMPF